MPPIGDKPLGTSLDGKSAGSAGEKAVTYKPRLSCIERWRAEIVVLIVLPISAILWLVRKVQRALSAPSPALHEERVRAVCKAVRANGEQLMRTDRSVYESHSVRNSDKTAVRQVPLRQLRAVLGLSRTAGAVEDAQVCPRSEAPHSTNQESR